MMNVFNMRTMTLSKGMRTSTKISMMLIKSTQMMNTKRTKTLRRVSISMMLHSTSSLPPHPHSCQLHLNLSTTDFLLSTQHLAPPLPPPRRPQPLPNILPSLPLPRFHHSDIAASGNSSRCNSTSPLRRLTPPSPFLFPPRSYIPPPLRCAVLHRRMLLSAQAQAQAQAAPPLLPAPYTFQHTSPKVSPPTPAPRSPPTSRSLVPPVQMVTGGTGSAARPLLPIFRIRLAQLAPTGTVRGTFMMIIGTRGRRWLALCVRRVQLLPTRMGGTALDQGWVQGGSARGRGGRVRGQRL